RDSLSMQHRALLLYQQLIDFHLYDTSSVALIDIDLKRLRYVRSKAVMENKEELYYTAIKHVAEQYQRTPAAAQAWYLVAQWHADKAAKYHPIKDTAYRYENNIAEQICGEVILQKEESEGRVNCINLLKRIRIKQLTLLTEKVNLPAQPFRSLVRYRNISKVYLRVVHLDDALKSRLLNSYDEKYWQQLTDLTPLKSWEQSLPDTKDHQQHAAEIRIDALPVGTYMILAGTDQDFAREGNALAVQFVYVSSISFINSDSKYFALHRETGKPLAGATVQVWNNYYDYNIRKMNTSRAEKLTADDNGYFSVKDVKDRNGIRIGIDFGKDHLLMDDQFYGSSRDEETATLNAAKYEEANALVFLFTDRSVYRPGQTVYFKGIAVTKDFLTKRSKVLAGKKTKLFLENANNEEADSLTLTTNEFGSYAGSFRLPENTLNGEFTLRDKDIPGELRFSVEEYKRPRFYVEYEKLKGTYKVNDSIRISGFAKAYAGNNIDGASIKYRVVRVPRFIYPWLWGRRVRPATAEMEITNGEAVTDGEGRFTILFKAIPDASIDRLLEPVFDYRVVTDITDNNGETRSGETMVSVSYKALLLKVIIPPGGALPADSLNSVSISTKNTNGEFEPALVTLHIYPLQQPRRLIRARLWEQSDQFVMGAKEYTDLFPHDEYDDEKSKENWVRGAVIAITPDTSKADGQFTIMHKGFLPGWYLLEASTTDKYGSPVKDVQYIRLYGSSDKRLPVPEYITSSIDKSTVEPGEKASITLGSTANDLTIIEWMQREPMMGGDSRIGGDFKLFKLDNETRAFDYDVTEADRGGISVAYLLVKDNRFYALNNTIAVHCTNKELNISY
ncbi:MAG: alpha-2-macroglobulin, partial [Chitinophagaceae bacterium]|nr:alpha-2-macroglobulin [Chitinophagaceae bacterium]